MIWFLTICNGPLRKCIKSFGMPCKIMGGLNENGEACHSSFPFIMTFSGAQWDT